MYDSDRELRGEWATTTANDLGRIADALERISPPADFEYTWCFPHRLQESDFVAEGWKLFAEIKGQTSIIVRRKKDGSDD